jgi:Protein of unknown function (DUF4019)
MKVPLSLVVLILFASFVARPQAQAKPEELAKKAAESWLTLMDEGKYGDSWSQAAQVFKVQIKKGQWETTARAVRSPLGTLQSRTLKSATYKTSLPGAPDGEYVVIQYDSSFEHKQSGVETVTPMLDKDGTWRVSGYQIR